MTSIGCLATVPRWTLRVRKSDGKTIALVDQFLGPWAIPPLSRNGEPLILPDGRSGLHQPVIVCSTLLITRGERTAIIPEPANFPECVTLPLPPPLLILTQNHTWHV